GLLIVDDRDHAGGISPGGEAGAAQQAGERFVRRQVALDAVGLYAAHRLARDKQRNAGLRLVPVQRRLQIAARHVEILGHGRERQRAQGGRQSESAACKLHRFPLLQSTAIPRGLQRETITSPSRLSILNPNTCWATRVNVWIPLVGMVASNVSFATLASAMTSFCVL